MTKEDKELLLKDLCARIHYGVKISIPYIFISREKLVGICEDRGVSESGDWANIERIKPYLRPMSSMTEEEKKHWRDISLSRPDWDFTTRCLDWLNSRHFDYRGLIERGLALEAPEGMYK